MIRRQFGASVFLLVLAFGSATAGFSAAQQQPPLDNTEVVKLTKLELGDAVIIAKIRSATTVKFDTTADDLARLKGQGVSSAVIAAMLDRLGAGTPASGAAPKVTLRSTDGSTDLEPTWGTAKTQAAPFSVVTWVQFDDLSAKTRTRERRPTVLVTSENVRGRWWFVRLGQQDDDDDEYRYFDLEGGGMFSVVWSGAPEKGSIVKCDTVEESPGVWAFTPLKELKPGEYGLFSGQVHGAFTGQPQGQAVLFDFGVDK